MSPKQHEQKMRARAEAEHHHKHASVYGMKEYSRDMATFEPEQEIKHKESGEEIPMSQKAFKAQERLNAHRELAKEYFSKGRGSRESSPVELGDYERKMK